MPRENKGKGGKLIYWMDYALAKFKTKFWKAFAEMGLEAHTTGQFIIHIAKEHVPKPASPFQLKEKFEDIGEAKQRNQALNVLLELIARLEIAADPLLRDKIVMEGHDQEAPSKELGKLAKRILGNEKKKPESYHGLLRQLPIQMRSLEVEFRLGTLSGEGFFVEDLEVLEHKQLLMKWRYFLAARNYERIHHLSPYSVCKLSLENLNRATDALRAPSALVRVWRQIANFQENPNWEEYVELKEILRGVKEAGSMDFSELADSYRVLLNYLLPRLGGDDPRILEEAFLLFSENIEDELFLQGKRIHPRDLKNIISICIRMDKVAEARRLFEKFKALILNDAKGQAEAYNSAVVLFGERKFKEAGAQFVQVMHASDDFYLKTDGKIYAMRCLIELQVAKMDGSVNFFPGSEESIEMFFRRQKDFPESVYQYYLGIFKMLSEFSSVWGSLESERRKRWMDLKQSLVGFSDPYLVEWLQSKIDQCLEAHL